MFYPAIAFTPGITVSCKNLLLNMVKLAGITMASENCTVTNPFMFIKEIFALSGGVGGILTIFTIRPVFLS